MNNWFLLTIEKIEKAQDLSQLKTIMIDIQEQLNCDYVLYNIQLSNSFEKTFFLIVSNFPHDWIQRYKIKDYPEIDPVLKHCVTYHTPICWEQFYHSPEPTIFNLFQELKANGLSGGISIGMRKNSGEVGIFSVAKKELMLEGSQECCDAMVNMAALQPYIHDAIARVSKFYQEHKEKPTLTKRELECLHLMTEGKTSLDMADILDISEYTVTFHIKNIIEKLGVKNRIQAIAKAVLMGLLSPQEHDENQRIYYY